MARLDHDGAVRAVAFSPDGTRVASASNDRSARVFELQPDALIRRAMERLTRPLNEQELRRYGLKSGAVHVALWRRDRAPL